jgi:hypothetical protein
MAKLKTKNVHAASHVVRTTFDGLPIVDAKADFTLVVRTKDVSAAQGYEKDAANCILAKACASQVGASKVAFFRRTAYLDLPDNKGKRMVVRYKLDDDAAAIVAAFDRGKSVQGEVSVTLKAPKPSESLDRVAESSRRKRANQRKAVLNGTIVRRGPTSGPPRMARISSLDVRNGTGLVHNTLKQPSNP